MQAHEHDVVIGQGGCQALEVEEVVVAGGDDALASERRGIEDDPPALRQLVARPNGGCPIASPIPEEDVRARDTRVGHEAIERLIEGLRIERSDAHR